MQSTPIDFIALPALTIIGAFLSRQVIATIIDSLLDIKVFYYPIPVIGIPVCILYLVTGHPLGPLTVIGFFAIDFYPLIAFIKNNRT